MAAQWKAVAEEEARQRKDYGFGGWMWPLYLLLLYLIWTRLSMVFRVPQFDLEMVYETARQAKTMEYFAFVEILLWVPFLVLAPLGHRLLPRLATYAFGAWWALTVIMMVFVIDISMGKSAFAVGFSTVVAALYVSYLARSRRVNLTCRLRERAE
jgi:sterol desaturase/sphingolipid hydroxylase (fatty acid hydroxylase superfamily)